MGAYVMLPLVAGEEGCEGVRADKKSSVKKAREKAERMTMRGVRIAAAVVLSIYPSSLSSVSLSYLC